jgi:polar amino acid transport system substrate-binding protein
MIHFLRLIAFACCIFATCPAGAQDRAADNVLSFATVERAPFTTTESGVASGFSLELMKIITSKIEVEIEFYDSFTAMLTAVENGAHDGADANISITADRESTLDFTQPIFESGIDVLLLSEDTGHPTLSAIWRRDILLAILGALALLFGSGMLMWVFERNKQAFFDRPGRDAMFPAFWWALNLVVNGRFEERIPQSRSGRFFVVILVVASLFMVSIFVATITAAMTVDALQDNVDSINDLEGRRVATIERSTSAAFLTASDLSYSGYALPSEILLILKPFGWMRWCLMRPSLRIIQPQHLSRARSYCPASTVAETTELLCRPTADGTKLSTNNY